MSAPAYELNEGEATNCILKNAIKCKKKVTRFKIFCLNLRPQYSKQLQSFHWVSENPTKQSKSSEFCSGHNEYKTSSQKFVSSHFRGLLTNW